jgi:thiamine-phosphate pyrophosphorylase
LEKIGGQDARAPTVVRKLPEAPFLYPILDSAYSVDLLGDAREAIRAGVRILQLRAKDLSKRRIFEMVEELSPLCLEKSVCMIVNDHVDIALVSNARGVHLGQDDFPAAEARRLLPDKIIGISTHTEQQFTGALELSVDYIAVGPIYSSLTKPRENPGLGASFLRRIRAWTTLPLVCIGGIQRHQFGELLSAGADGIALISEIYRTSSVYDSISALLQTLKAASHEKI